MGAKSIRHSSGMLSIAMLATAGVLASVSVGKVAGVFVGSSHVAAGTAQAGFSYADPVGGWTYIYTGDQCATQFDAALDGKWHHYDASSGGSDAWDGTAPGQMGASPNSGS